MFKKLLVLFVVAIIVGEFFSLAINVKAQTPPIVPDNTGTLTVNVYETTTLSPIQDAEVFANNYKKCNTGANGQCSFQITPDSANENKATFILKVTKSGYETSEWSEAKTVSLTPVLNVNLTATGTVSGGDTATEAGVALDLRDKFTKACQAIDSLSKKDPTTGKYVLWDYRYGESTIADAVHFINDLAALPVGGKIEAAHLSEEGKTIYNAAQTNLQAANNDRKILENPPYNWTDDKYLFVGDTPGRTIAKCGATTINASNFGDLKSNLDKLNQIFSTIDTNPTGLPVDSAAVQCFAKYGMNAIAVALCTVYKGIWGLVIGWMGGAVDWLINTFLLPVMGIRLHDDLLPGGSQPWVIPLWKFSISLVDIVVIAILIALSFINILNINIDTYAIKKTLPTLILGVILANFSLLICRMIVDVSNVLTATFANDIGTGLIAGLGLDKFAALIPFLQILMLIITLLIFFFAILFWIRLVLILLLSAVSPLAFMAMAFPPTQNLFRRWWSTFTTWVFMAPVMIILLKVASLMGQGVKAEQGWSFQTLIGLIGEIVLLMIAVMVPFKMGGAIMSAWYGVMKFAGKQGIAAYGLGAYRLQQGVRGKEIAEKHKESKKGGPALTRGENFYRGLGNFMRVTNPNAIQRGVQSRLEQSQLEIGKEAYASPTFAAVAGKEAAWRSRRKVQWEEIQNMWSLDELKLKMGEFQDISAKLNQAKREGKISQSDLMTTLSGMGGSGTTQPRVAEKLNLDWAKLQDLSLYTSQYLRVSRNQPGLGSLEVLDGVEKGDLPGDEEMRMARGGGARRTVWEPIPGMPEAERNLLQASANNPSQAAAAILQNPGVLNVEGIDAEYFRTNQSNLLKNARFNANSALSGLTKSLEDQKMTPDQINQIIEQADEHVSDDTTPTVAGAIINPDTQDLISVYKSARREEQMRGHYYGAFSDSAPRRESYAKYTEDLTHFRGDEEAFSARVEQINATKQALIKESSRLLSEEIDPAGVTRLRGFGLTIEPDIQDNKEAIRRKIAQELEGIDDTLQADVQQAIRQGRNIDAARQQSIMVKTMRSVEYEELGTQIDELRRRSQGRAFDQKAIGGDKTIRTKIRSIVQLDPSIDVGSIDDATLDKVITDVLAHSPQGIETYQKQFAKPEVQARINQLVQFELAQRRRAQRPPAPPPGAAPGGAGTPPGGPTGPAAPGPAAPPPGGPGTPPPGGPAPGQPTAPPPPTGYARPTP